MYLYYILILLILPPGLLINQRSDKGYKDLYCIYAFFLLVIISGLRGYSVGGDLHHYIPLFEKIAKQPLTEIFEDYDKYGIIFKLYIKLWSFIASGPTYFLFVTSLINVGVVCWFIRKRSPIIWLSFFLYIALGYYTNSFNSVRSTMALVMGIIGVNALMQDKKLKALIFFIIAFEIHKTIVPIFLLFAIGSFKPRLPVLVTSIIGCFILANVIGISGLANIILWYSTGYGEALNFEGRGYNLLALDCIITIGCYYLCRNNLNKQRVMLLNILWLATCLQCIAPLFSYATRISYFFTFYSILLIPDAIMAEFKVKSRPIILCSLVVLSMIYFKMTIMTATIEFTKSNAQSTLPYYFYWEQPK